MWNPDDIGLLSLFGDIFHVNRDEAVKVHIEVRMQGADVERRTTLTTENGQLHQSRWTVIRRAR